MAVNFVVGERPGGRIRRPERELKGKRKTMMIRNTELTQSSFLPDVETDVAIGTGQLDGEEGRIRNVSTIEMTLSARALTIKKINMMPLSFMEAMKSMIVVSKMGGA